MRKLALLVAFVLTFFMSVNASNSALASALPGHASLDMADLAAVSTFTATADAFVRTDYPRTNYGTYPEVRAQSTPLLIGFVKFNVQGLSGAVSKAVLRMYSLSGVASGYKAYGVSSGWNESTINHDNSPYLGTLLGASGAVSANAWTSIDVTAYVTGNGIYSFGLTDPSAAMIRLASRETARPPQLVVQTASGATATAAPTIKPAGTATPTVRPSRTPTPAIKPTNTPTVKPPSTPTVGPFLWSTSMETGDLSQWSNGGGEFNSGSYTTSASRDYSHSGVYSAKLTITTPPESGVRLFRWHESQTYPSLYYSTWYYFPRAYSAPNYWNIMQWKSKTSTANDPFYTLNVSTSGGMKLYLYDWQRRVSYSQSAKTIPAGQWVHVEAFYRCAPDSAGQVTIWQDGTQLINVSGKSTRYSNGDCQWSVNNYSDSVSPSPATIYVDDAAISQWFIP